MSEAVAAMAAKLNDEALSMAWMATEGQPVTNELAMVRGWIMDELNRRLGDNLFDEWLMAVGETGEGEDPPAFLSRKPA